MKMMENYLRFEKWVGMSENLFKPVVDGVKKCQKMNQKTVKYQIFLKLKCLLL